MKTPTINKIIAIIGLAISLTILFYYDWSFINLMHKSPLWTIAYIYFMIVVGVYFAYGFLYRYDFQRFKKWLIPAAVMAYITPILVSICVSQDVRHFITIGLHLAVLLIGVRVLVWHQGRIEKGKKETI